MSKKIKKLAAGFTSAKQKDRYETLSIENINFSPYDYETSKDQKVYVFRLNSQNWRMIGIKSEINTDVLHIIGFDFDFTAYNHGK